MASDESELNAEIRRLLSEGRKIEAIRRYREQTGADLAAAKAAVEALQRDEPPAPPAEDSPDAAEIVALLQGGKKIEAIKLYRQRTGVGLKEAKDAVEALAADRRIVVPSGSGCLGAALLLACVPLGAIVLGAVLERIFRVY